MECGTNRKFIGIKVDELALRIKKGSTVAFLISSIT